MPRTPLEPRFTVEYLSILDAEGNLDSALDPALPPAELKRLYARCFLARRFDERMVRLQRQGRIGTFAPIKGQRPRSSPASRPAAHRLDGALLPQTAAMGRCVRIAAHLRRVPRDADQILDPGSCRAQKVRLNPQHIPVAAGCSGEWPRCPPVAASTTKELVLMRAEARGLSGMLMASTPTDFRYLPPSISLRLSMPFGGTISTMVMNSPRTSFAPRFDRSSRGLLAPPLPQHAAWQLARSTSWLSPRWRAA